MFFSRIQLWPAVLLLVLANCSPKPESGSLRHVGILPFENLSGDVSLDWLGRAVASVISTQLAVPQSIVPVEVNSVRDAASANVTELVHGYFSVSGDELRLTAQLRNPLTLQNGKLLTASSKLSGGVLPLMDSLSRQISPAAHSYGTRNEAAVPARKRFQ